MKSAGAAKVQGEKKIYGILLFLSRFGSRGRGDSGKNTVTGRANKL